MQIKTDKILKQLQLNKYLQLFPDFKEEKTKKITYIALTLLALSLFALFAINPTISTIIKLHKELADSKFVDQRLERKINDLSILQEKYKSLEVDLPAIYSAIPTNPNATLLVAQIQSIAEGVGLKINSVQIFSVDVDSGLKPYSSFNFSLNANGTYSQITNFIQALTSNRRITTQDIIAISRQTGKDNSLLFSVRGEAFFKKL